MEERYCLCDIESSEKADKMQPVILTLAQNSLWFGKENKQSTSQVEQEENNLFVFDEDEDINDYCSASFNLDENISNYYCVSFYNGIETKANIVNNGYNEIPLNIRIYGKCVNPLISLFRKNSDTPIRQFRILATINNGYYVEINSRILENGIWYVNQENGNKIDYSELIDNELGSPYFYIDNGEYYITVSDSGNNICYCNIFWQEEYSE